MLRSHNPIPFALFCAPALFINVSAAELVATYNVQAQSEKIYYDTIEPVVAQIKLANNSEKKRRVEVAVWLEAGIDLRTDEQNKTVVLEPNETLSLPFRWDAQPLGMYGYALRCSVTGDMSGGAVDYFTVCDNYWNVALSTTHPFALTALYTEKQVTDRLAQLRKEFYNGFEKFFWAPDDFADMTPEDGKYFSGQVRYHESTEIIKFMIEEAHRHGMRATTYGKNMGSGSVGAEFVRANPEMVYRTNGRLNMQAKVRALHYWDKPQNWSGQQANEWQETNWIFYNMNKPEVIQHGSREIARSAKMLGWDGVRFDGHFAAKTSWEGESGKTHQLTPEESDALTASNIRHMKEIILAEHPNFYFGYNYLNSGAADAMRSQPLEFKELCRGGGHIMNEYIGQAGDVNHPLYRWETFTTLMADDQQIVRQHGGHYFPILNYVGSDLWYVNAIAYASGAHPYYRHVWGGFATRYAGVLWDCELERINDPDKLLSVPDGMWGRKFVHQRTSGEDRQQVIVHLINPPVRDVVTNDKDGRFPDPRRDLSLEVSPEALGEGWTLARATLLDPDDISQTKLPIPARSNGSHHIAIPEVRVWKVVVLDFSKS